MPTPLTHLRQLFQFCRAHICTCGAYATEYVKYGRVQVAAIGQLYRFALAGAVVGDAARVFLLQFR